MSDLRARDGNGHTPDDQAPSDYERGYKAGYDRALLDFMFKMIGKAHEDLTAALEKLTA